MSAAELARVLVVMLGRGRGGIEQAAIDQARLLAARGHAVRLVLADDAAIAGETAALDVVALPRRGPFDVFAALKLRAVARAFRAGAILCNGRRAFVLSRLARAPRIFVAHNYVKPQQWRKADAVIAVSERLRALAQQNGVAAENAYAVPNVVAAPERVPARAPFQSPPIIGAFGRHVPKKGFHILLDALTILRARGAAFRAVIGGDGEMRQMLVSHAADAGLGDVVSFPGWIENKAAFFESCDLFCIPSLHEPFGIIVLETLAAGVPLIATTSEGPQEILAGHDAALLVTAGDAEALANALEEALTDEDAMRARSDAGFRLIKDHYTDDAVAGRLSDAVNRIAGRARKSAP